MHRARGAQFRDKFGMDRGGRSRAIEPSLVDLLKNVEQVLLNFHQRLDAFLANRFGRHYDSPTSARLHDEWPRGEDAEPTRP